MRKVITVAALLMLFPFSSQAKTLDELLVEKGVVAQDEIRAGGHMGSGAKVYWNKGTRLEFPDTGFSASVFTELRTRYEFVDGDSDVGADNTSGVSVTNARLGVTGHILNREFTYYVKTALNSDDETGSSGADLLDAYISWDACEMASVKLGQFKSGISRQYNTSLVNMQFADRSVASDFNDLGRQGGVAADLNVLDGIELGAQFLNGVDDGINSASDDIDHSYVVTARVPLAGELDPYSEGDVDGTEDLAADVGVAYAFSDVEDDDLQSLSVDANVKSNGTSLHAELFWSDFEADVGGTETDTVGFYVQAGHFLTPKELELAARYAYADCDDGKAAAINSDCSGNDDLSEVSVSLNHYWWKHHLKGQLGFSLLDETAVAGGTDETTTRWLVQLSGWF